MSFRDFPDCTVPPSDERCEALTKPRTGWPDWGRESHRCIRKATQGRAGRSVCAVHARMQDVHGYWCGAADGFPTPRNKTSK